MMQLSVTLGALIYALLIAGFVLSLTVFDQKSMVERRSASGEPLFYEPAFGQVQKVQGTAKIQRMGFLGWSSLKSKQDVHWYDLVYLGENSRVEILSNSGDAMSLVGECIQRISDELGLYPHLMRRFSWQQSASDSVASQEGTPHYFFRLLAPHVEPSRYLQLQRGATSTQRLTLIKNVHLRPIMRPTRDAVVIPTQLPVKLEILLAPSKSHSPSVAFLWNIQKQMIPEWTSANPKKRVFVPLNEPGQYVFQVISEDEGEATRPLSLIVLGEEQASQPEVIAKFSNWTRIFL